MTPIDELHAAQLLEPSDIRGHLARLRALVLALDARQVIELGVRHGRSTVAFLSGLDVTGGRLHSIDVRRPKVPACVWEHPRWTFTQADSVSAQAKRAAPIVADLVFVDTSHFFDHTVAELRAYAPRARVVALHDTLLRWHEGQPETDPEYAVAAAIDEFRRESPGWIVWLYRGSCGLAVLVRE